MRSSWLLPKPDIEWLDGVPRSRNFSDVYFSRQDGLAESRYVFIENNNLIERFQSLTQSHFWIAETGFGTGLNFLATWQAWRLHAPATATLFFSSTELYPLDQTQLQQALRHWPELGELAGQLVKRYPHRILGQHRIYLQPNVVLDLHFGDATEALWQWRDCHHCATPSSHTVDAWYLDGFTPSRNQALWSEELSLNIAALSGPETTFATFTASSHVRKQLQSVGFEVNKLSGFGAKREMLTGRFTKATGCPPQELQPWHAPSAVTTHDQPIGVIGSGIAGASIARALAERGREVVVYEAATEIAAGASGNSQGILYTKLSHERSLFSQFVLHSFLYALRYYPSFDSQRINLSNCGMILLEAAENLAPLFDSPNFVRDVSTEEASALAGMPLNGGGLFFQDGGWLSPRLYCETALDHPLIRVKTNHRVHQLGESPTVIANALFAREFIDWLPLRPIRGQVSECSAAHNLQTVLCGDNFAIPTGPNTLTCGASYDLNDSDTSVRADDSEHNLQRLQEMLPSVSHLEIGADRAGVRTASLDYLPLVGQVPNRDQFIERYGALRRDAKMPVEARGAYMPNVYLSVGYGSRGLSYAPLCAELLAAQMCNEPRPVPAEIAKILSPARFILRDLKRNRI